MPWLLCAYRKWRKTKSKWKKNPRRRFDFYQRKIKQRSTHTHTRNAQKKRSDNIKTRKNIKGCYSLSMFAILRCYGCSSDGFGFLILSISSRCARQKWQKENIRSGKLLHIWHGRQRKRNSFLIPSENWMFDILGNETTATAATTT